MERSETGGTPSTRSGSLETAAKPSPLKVTDQVTDRKIADQRPAGTFSQSNFFRDAVVALGCLGAATGLVYLPRLFDLPLTRLVNTWIYRSKTLNIVLYDLDAYATFTGVAFLAILWGCWFSARLQEEEEVRSRMLAGVLVSIPAGVLSRFLQHGLPTHPRPFFDPALGFHPAFLSSFEQLNTWNSFPSDHATVFAALVTVICMVRADLRKFVIPWFVVVEFARLYMGAHYPTDLLGGTALGALAVFTAQTAWIVDFCRRLAWKAKDRPLLFYSLAFVVTYQIATLFVDVRGVMHHIR